MDALGQRWASDVERYYEPLRFVGSGGFSSVWVAKPKDTKPRPRHSIASMQVCTCDHVAIKSTATAQHQDSLSALEYAKNEVNVLQELEHPHIVKVVKVFSFESDVYSVALTLASGPTLEQLVKHGGALGIPLAQCVAKQLVSALAYMHSRGVIHRDIKPDNVILTGANMPDDANWCDRQDDPQVEKLLMQWHIILIDFGLAKALGPDEFKCPSTNYPSKNCELNASLTNSTLNSLLQENTVERKKRLSFIAGKSFSRIQVLNLSAVGHQNFVAPEVLKTLRTLESEENEKEDSRGASKPRRGHFEKIVSDYGMNVDSFSLGAFLRYILTGVPPQFTTEEYISLQNSFIAATANFFFPCCRQNSVISSPGERNLKKRKIRIKIDSEIPNDAANLVYALALNDPLKRLTVRQAQCHPWIKLKDKDDFSVHAPLEFINIMSTINEAHEQEKHSFHET